MWVGGWAGAVGRGREGRELMVCTLGRMIDLLTTSNGEGRVG